MGGSGTVGGGVGRVGMSSAEIRGTKLGSDEMGLGENMRGLEEDDGVVGEVVVVEAGQGIRLKCEARGSRPPARLSWRLRGADVTQGKQQVGGYCFVCYCLKKVKKYCNYIFI